MRALVAVCLVTVIIGVRPAVAQTTNGNVEVGAHVSTLRLSEFTTTDTGLGVDAFWRATSTLAIDGALTWFPGSRNSVGDRIAGQQRTLGLVGVRSGVRKGRVDLFGRARAGFLRFAPQDGAVCAAVTAVPTPPGCQIATGYSALATDFGGGIAIAIGESLRLRLDAGDLIVRYGLRAYRPNGKPTDGFASHNLQMSAGLGWRF